MSLTPSDIETAARNQYNATNDTFFGQNEIFRYIEEAANELARLTNCIERVYTTTSVAGTQDYNYPTNTIKIYRVTYNGHKIDPYTFREDDAVTLSNSSSTSQGTSLYYTQFNYTMSLRPIPDSAVTLKVYSFNLHSTITVTSTLEIPDVYQHGIIDFVCSKLAAKDQNYQAATYYRNLWNGNPLSHLAQAQKHQRRMKRGDSPAMVQNVDTLPTTILGVL